MVYINDKEEVSYVIITKNLNKTLKGLIKPKMFTFSRVFYKKIYNAYIRKSISIKKIYRLYKKTMDFENFMKEVLCFFEDELIQKISRNKSLYKVKKIEYNNSKYILDYMCRSCENLSTDDGRGLYELLGGKYINEFY